MTRLEDYKLRVAGFWQKYRKSKMGLTGLGIIVFFLFVALIAPVLSQWPLPISVDVAPRLSAPLWLLPLNPYGFQRVSPLNNTQFSPSMQSNFWVENKTSPGEGYIVVANPSFDANASGWTFSPGNPITTGAWVSGDGAPDPGSGPGCYQVQFADTSPATAYGTSHTYLQYPFLFNASKYPPGFMSQHPSLVTVQYSISVLMYRTIKDQADMLFAVEMSNSSGPYVVLFSRQYFLNATAWSGRSYDMSAVNVTFTGTDTMNLRVHLTFRDPVPINTPSIIVRVDDIQCFIQADYNNTATAPNVEGQWDGSEGNPADGELGSYRIVLRDDSTTTSYRNPSGWIQSGFTWNFYERPKGAFIRYVYKVVIDGDPGDAYINIIQEVYVENTGNTVEVLEGKDIRLNMTWTPSANKVMDAFMITDTFDERGTLWVRYRVELTDPTPQDTFTFTIYLDDCEIEVLGGYYGLLGAGQYGEDLWSQLLWGSRIAMAVGLLAALIATFVGLIVGLISGFFGGLIDEVLMRVTDFFLVIPGLPLMIVLAAILTPHWWNIVLVIALVGWTGTARLVRSQVLAERQKAYVEAARAIGASDLYIIFRHILPNVTPLLFAQISLGVAGSILTEAGLSFLGLTHPSDVSWGRMLMQASGSGAYSEGAWWYVFFPGVCIVLLALSFTLVGYAVDEILNPRLRIRKE
jgi:peptide/nickel transport system permease protein